MNKIDMIEEKENELPIVKKELSLESSASLPWQEYLKLKGFDKEAKEPLEEMCKKCIKKQHAEHGRIRIKCKGLATSKNILSEQYGEDVYNQMMEVITDDGAKQEIEALYNPIKWIDQAIQDEDMDDRMFSPRWYQSKILNCTASRKVLRMGRRCIDGEERIQGKRKTYSVKHLFELAKNHKRLPKILTYNTKTFETEYTDRYYLLPNPETTLIHLTFSNNTSVKITKEHPLLVYKDKQFYFEESQNINENDILVTKDNQFVYVTKKEKVFNRKTYHITVLDTHTFIGSNGLIHHNTGKALDINTPIPTPNGWTTMEFVKEGDQVFDDAGNICNVTFATEIQYNRTCYEIEFDNGSKLVADEDHQWNVFTDSKKEFTTTTKFLVENEEKFYIRVSKAVDKDTVRDRENNLIHLLKDFGEVIDSFYKLPRYIDDTDIASLVSSLGIKVFYSDSYILFNSLKHNNESLSIKAITPIETRPVKCISVDSPKNLYLAGKDYIVTHNTASMTVGLLHRLVTYKDYKVLMVAPMQTMIDEVYSTIVKYCEKMENNPIIAKSTTPIHEIVFNTGSTFKGVTAGAQGAKGTRGKGADLIYIDECLTAFTRIMMSDGRTKAIIDVDEGEYVLSYDTETGKFLPKRVTAVKCTGVKEVFKYRTMSGKIIEATSNHPVLTSEGFKPIGEAKDIAVPYKKINGIYFESILGCTRKGLEKVYNLTVDGTHVYIANGMIVHNCDFLSVKAMESIIAILADTISTEFWASSTPMGERNLHKLSSDARYKEFHYPTYVSPTYSDDIDEDFRTNMDISGLIQEILAEFGSDDNMAFQLPFIDACTLDSDKEIDPEAVLRDRQNYDIVIGCDWNKSKVGTRILVVARHKRDKRLLIVEKFKISALERTQLVAVQAIKDLNRKWLPDYIYVDEGHGEAQGADLREEGAKALSRQNPHDPDIRLLDVKSIQFGASIMIRDHTTGKEYKKQTKNYMVENLSRIISAQGIILQEDLDRNIILQLKNYCILSQSASGLKTFGARDKVTIGDHDLDALLLAALAFRMNLDDEFGSSSVSFAPIVNSKESVGFSTLNVEKKELIISSEQMIVNKPSRGSQSRGRRQFKTRRGW